jgi:hypothetical protein
MLGSSGPAQRKVICSKIDYSENITSAEFSSTNGMKITRLLGYSESCGLPRIIGINPRIKEVILVVVLN